MAQSYKLDLTNNQGWSTPPFAKKLVWANLAGMEPINMSTIRAALLREMATKGIKPTTLSLEVGRNRSLVKDLLEKNNDVTVGTLTKLADALGVPVRNLMTADPYTGQGQSHQRSWSPDPETVATLLSVAMRVDEDDLEKFGEIQDYASAVCAGLRWISEEPASERDPGFLKAVRKRVAEAIDGQRSQPSRSA